MPRQQGKESNNVRRVTTAQRLPAGARVARLPPPHLFRKPETRNEPPTSTMIHKKNFVINLKVRNYDPEDLSVKTANGFVVVEGSHEEKQDGNFSFISRRVTQRFAVPDRYRLEDIHCKITTGGILTITIPEKEIVEDEGREIPVVQLAPTSNPKTEPVPSSETDTQEGASATPSASSVENPDPESNA